MLFDCLIKSIEPEVGFLVFGIWAVALKAFVGENRADISVEIYFSKNRSKG
jgi:hypothetical protein